MDRYYIYIGVILTVVILIPLYRVLRGPTLFDRMLGAGAIGTKTMVIIVVIGAVHDRRGLLNLLFRPDTPYAPAAAAGFRRSR